MKEKIDHKLFFQKQKDHQDGCRIYAINNLLERIALNEDKFDAYCYEFDNLYKCKGTREFFFIESDNNIITFILNKFNISTTYYPPYSFKSVENILETSNKFLAFCAEHILCCRTHSQTWYYFDSMAKAPSKLNFKQLSAKFGYIVVN